MSADSADPRTDDDLVAAANAGDARAFEALYERYRDWVVRLAWRLSGDRELALDVCHDAFLALLRRFPGFELRSQMRSFLYPVVRHLAIAAAKRNRRLRLADPAGEDASSDTVLGGDPASDLAAAVARLPAGQREVLILRFVDDLALQEIATSLEIPLGTVKSRLHHALAALRADQRIQKYE